MSKYRLGITTSYFNEEATNLETSYLKDFREEYKKYEIVELLAEVIEKEDFHISGVIAIKFDSENDETAKEFVKKFIENHSLKGECLGLQNSEGTQIATEEEFE